VPGQLFLRAGRIDQAADRLRDVVIHDLGNPSRRRTIYADSGYMRFNTDRTDLFLTLFDGYVHDYDRTQAEVFRRVFFGTDLVRVRGVSNRLERTGDNEFKGDREMSLCEMEAVVAGDMRAVQSVVGERRNLLLRDALALVGVVAPPGDSTPPRERRSLTALYCGLLSRLSRRLVPPELRADTLPIVRRGVQRADVPPRVEGIARPRPNIAGDPSGEQLRGQLATLESRRRAALQHAASFQVEIHKKWSLAASCLVFVLIGAPVALRFPRGGAGLVIGASVVIFGFYYIGLIGGEPLADRLLVPPFWAMWTPNLLMAAAGVALFVRLGREHAAGRGGRRRWWRRP
jgi:lipopolysaccharide export system permease protein